MYELWIKDGARVERVTTAADKGTLRRMWRPHRDAALVLRGEVLEFKTGCSDGGSKAIATAARQAFRPAPPQPAPPPAPAPAGDNDQANGTIWDDMHEVAPSEVVAVCAAEGLDDAPEEAAAPEPEPQPAPEAQAPAEAVAEVSTTPRGRSPRPSAPSRAKLKAARKVTPRRVLDTLAPTGDIPAVLAEAGEALRLCRAHGGVKRVRKVLELFAAWRVEAA